MSNSEKQKSRLIFRDALGEFCGVTILVIFGVGVNCQVVLSTDRAVVSSPRGDYLSIAFGWAAGLALGAWIAGIIRKSPGHINPAVTLALEFRAFLSGKRGPTIEHYGSTAWDVLPLIVVFTFSQLLGGIFGAAIIYANYVHAIDIFEGGGIRTVPGTASLFAIYAAEYMTPASCFFDEFLGTAILLLVICALGDLRDIWEQTPLENGSPNETEQLQGRVEQGGIAAELDRMAGKLGGMVGKLVGTPPRPQAVATEQDEVAARPQAVATEQGGMATNLQNMATNFHNMATKLREMGVELNGNKVAAEQDARRSSKARNPADIVAPFILFIVTLGIVVALGMQTGFALNPARDLGPRILTAMVGYGKAVFLYRSLYWLWCPFIAPILGAFVAVSLYHLCNLVVKEPENTPENTTPAQAV